MKSTDAFTEQNVIKLVKHLKVEEAFNNHGLGDVKISTIKQLYVAIEKNPVQFQTALTITKGIRVIRHSN